MSSAEAGGAGLAQIAGSIPQPLLAECRGVPEQDALTLTAPEELAVDPAWLTRCAALHK